ncbi:MAG TPA: hypothetical protein VNY32_05345, partial [Candidatus Acidoferrales bacterium]|nr:hypothetical protein [Candidatus Acidoferrales bacterium]
QLPRWRRARGPYCNVAAPPPGRETLFKSKHHRESQPDESLSGAFRYVALAVAPVERKKNISCLLRMVYAKTGHTIMIATKTDLPGGQ